jgi:pSer/pThr/pTyr-binding forkhead associated (FHA) protein
MADEPKNRLSEIRSSLSSGRALAKNRKILVFTLQARGGAAGAERERVFRLDKERVVIGSVISADVRLSGHGVAPIHAVVELTSDKSGEKQAVVYDLASETGVFVNGVKAITQPLKPGDELAVGHYYLKFALESLEAAVQAHPVRATRESEGRKLFANEGEDFSPLLLQDERDVEEIFDYRPAEREALEVVMSFSGTILNVEHFVERPAVTIGGGRDADFPIPAILSSGSPEFPLVTRTALGAYELNLDPKMTGVVQRQGVLMRVESQQSRKLAIEKNDFAKIAVGAVDFYLSFTAAPPRLKLGKLFERDPLFLKIFLSSMLLTALTITALIKARVPQEIQAEQIPERIATILYQPQKYGVHPKEHSESVAKPTQETTPPKPQPIPQQTTKLEITPNPKNTAKPIPAEMNVGDRNSNKTGKATHNKNKGSNHAQGEAKQGKGAKAKGDSGTRGTKNASPNADKQNKAARPSPDGGKGSGGGSGQVQSEGNVDVLKDATAKLENILGDTSAHLGKSGERLKGFGGFDTRGNDGLALSGGGKGGGGTADQLGGLADKGQGGGRVGTGQGAAGSGSGIIGGSARVVIRSGGPEEAVVMGAIDADAVEAALLAHKDEFRRCYEKEINAEAPAKSGRVGTSFVIGGSGKVTQAGVESTTLGVPPTESCIIGVIKSIQFPIPRGGGIVQVTYPFKFSAVGH